MDHPMNFPETGFSRAVLSILDTIQEMLPDRVAEASIDCVLVGGAAVHLYTGHRVSRDVEAIFDARIILPNDLVVTYMEGDQQQAVTLDANYMSAMALLHPDAVADAISFGAYGKFILRALAPVDLAVTKIGRWQGNDMNDVGALAQCGLLSETDVEERTREALTYFIGYPNFIEVNLHEALDLIRRARQNIRKDSPGPGDWT